jgi:hypothetical protein
MTDHAEPKNIDEALFILQQDPPVLIKDQDGQVGNQKTKYADLVQANEKILARLTALGVLWKTKPTTVMIAGPNGQQDARFVLDYRLLHVKSGTFEDGIYPLPAGANPMQNGSAITYARRYALIAVTNTVAEGMDDDGGGYRGREGMAQRANVRQERSQSTAQRAAAPAAAPRGERAQPAQRPTVPAPTSPAAPLGDAVRGRGGLITEPMTRKLAITMKEVIGDNPADRKQFITDMIGREVATSKDLTFDEGRGLIDAFEKAKATEVPIANVIDIYRRTTGDAPPPAKATAARKTAPAGRSLQESVTGTPPSPNDDAPPWESEPPTDDGAR